MRSLNDQRREPPRAPLPAEVTFTAAATIGTYARFTLDNGDATEIRGPWMPIVVPHGIDAAETPLTPQAGNAGLALLSDAGNYWIVCWWPN